MKKLRAYTLAEILATLTIIGVIAAVTIPTLNTSNQDKKYLALTKKALATLQGATDAKIALTSTVPKNDELFEWLTSEDERDEDTLKTVFVSSINDAAITPDGMAFFARINNAGVPTDTRFKNEGLIYVDLNGAEGPTETTKDNIWNLENAHVSGFDVVRFSVDRQGTFTADCDKAKQYLGI